jgi:hypothetical protein
MDIPSAKAEFEGMGACYLGRNVFRSRKTIVTNLPTEAG